MSIINEMLERESGHILVGFALLVAGAILWKVGIPKSEDLIPFALGVIGRSMGSLVNGKK